MTGRCSFTPRYLLKKRNYGLKNVEDMGRAGCMGILHTCNSTLTLTRLFCNVIVVVKVGAETVMCVDFMS